MTTQNDRCTVKDVAEMFLVSSKTIVRWCNQGWIPYRTTLGGHRRFDRDVVQQMAVEHGFDPVGGSATVAADDEEGAA